MNSYELEEPSRVWDVINALQVVDAVNSDGGEPMAQLTQEITLSFVLMI